MIEEKFKKTHLYLDFNPLLLKISLVLFKSPRGKKLKILVIVRQTPDTEAKIKTNSSGDGIQTDDIKWILNPFDEYAVEEAVQIKEKSGAEVVVLTVGAERSVDAIRTSLAMGGDSGVHIKDDSFADMDSYALGKVIGSKIKSLGDIDLIIAGKKWIDEESNQVPIQVAEELGIPQATLASKVIPISEDIAFIEFAFAVIKPSLKGCQIVPFHLFISLSLLVSIHKSPIAFAVGAEPPTKV